MTRLAEHYEKTVRPALMERLGYTNRFAVPKLDKIVLNMGIGEAVSDSKQVEGALADVGGGIDLG